MANISLSELFSSAALSADEQAIVQKILSNSKLTDSERTCLMMPIRWMYKLNRPSVWRAISLTAISIISLYQLFDY